MHLVSTLELTHLPSLIILRWIAAVVLGLELPVPFYWLILHPNSTHWHRGAAKSQRLL